MNGHPVRARVADVVAEGPAVDGRGSGYLVADGWVLTAQHVVAAPPRSRCGWVPRPAWDRTAAGTSTSPPRFWTRDRTWRCFRSPWTRRAPWNRRCWGGWTAMLPLPCRLSPPGAPASSCGLARRGESCCATCTRRTARSRPARIRRPELTRWPISRLSQTRTRSRACTRPGRACPVPPCGRTSGSSASWPSTTRAKAVARSPCGPWRSFLADPPTVLLAGGRCWGRGCQIGLVGCG